MSKERQLFKNTVIVTIGKICTQLITFFLLPVYTAVLSTEEYGIVDFLNTLVSLVVPIITLQLEQGVFRYLIEYRDSKENQRKIISTIVLFLLSQTIIYLVLFLIASIFIKQQYKVFLATNVIASAFSAIVLQISRGLSDNKTYAKGSFITASTTVILNVIFIVWLKMGVYGMLSATFLGYLCGIIYIIIVKKLYKCVKIRLFDKVLLKEMLKYSIPLIPNMISWWVVNVSDRTIVTSILGVGMNGILSVANKFSNVFSTLYSVFNMTWTESASINIDADDRDEFFSKILNFIMRFFGSLALGMIACMPFAFGFLVNENFNDAYYQIPILIVASMFNILVSFIGSIYVAKKKTKEIAKTSVLAAVINLTVNLLLIKFIGLFAASISTLLAYFTMFVYRYIDSKKYVNLKFDVRYMVSMIISFIIVLVSYYLDYLYTNILVLLFIIVYAIYVNRNNFVLIKNMLISRFEKNKLK